MKLNNKGFAVSAILYSFLLAFILFMLVVITTFNSSSDIISASNDDIVNGNKFVANQLKISAPSADKGGEITGTCDGGATWYSSLNRKKIIIKTSHGSYYWPMNFTFNATPNVWVSNKGGGEKIEIRFTKGSKVDCESNLTTINNIIKAHPIKDAPDAGNFYCARIENKLTGETKNLHLVDVCNN